MNPGSAEAVAAGCRCPRFDNAHGRGYLGGVRDPVTGETVFVKRTDCPLHGERPVVEIDSLTRVDGVVLISEDDVAQVLKVNEAGEAGEATVREARQLQALREASAVSFDDGDVNFVYEDEL
jgi:hypothetical protein